MDGLQPVRMSSRERVRAALRGEAVDRTPVMYWLNPHAALRLVAEYHRGRGAIASAAARQMWHRFRAGGCLDAGELTRLMPLALREWVDSSYVQDLGADVAELASAVSNTRRFAGSVRRDEGQMRIAGPFGTVLRLGGIYLDVARNGVGSASEL